VPGGTSRAYIRISSWFGAKVAKFALLRAQAKADIGIEDDRRSNAEVRLSFRHRAEARAKVQALIGEAPERVVVAHGRSCGVAVRTTCVQPSPGCSDCRFRASADDLRLTDSNSREQCGFGR